MKYILIFLLALCLCANIQGQTIIQVTVHQPPKLIVDAGLDLLTEANEAVSLGTNLNISGGTIPYSYSWYTGESEFSSEENPVVYPSISTMYELFVKDGENCVVSDTLLVNIDYTGIINGSLESDDIVIYPNPVNENFIIDLPDKTFNVSLLSIDGQVIWVKSMRKSGSFPSPAVNGIYLIKIEGDEFSAVRSIIVNRK